MLAPFSGPWLVCTTKVYPGLGADTVMESISSVTAEQALDEIGSRQLLTFKASEAKSGLRWLVLQRRQLPTALRPKSLPSLLPAVRCGRWPRLGVRSDTGFSPCVPE